jgi:hypothetical protein
VEAVCKIYLLVVFGERKRVPFCLFGERSYGGVYRKEAVLDVGFGIDMHITIYLLLV